MAEDDSCDSCGHLHKDYVDIKDVTNDLTEMAPDSAIVIYMNKDKANTWGWRVYGNPGLTSLVGALVIAQKELTEMAVDGEDD